MVYGYDSFFEHMKSPISCDISVTKVTRYKLDDCSLFPGRNREFSLPPHIQTGSGIQLAS